MERWKRYFQNSGLDLWTVCERALILAYIESPDDFPTKRDKLAQKLFAPEKFDLKAWEKDSPAINELDPSSRDKGDAIGYNCKQDLHNGEVNCNDEGRLHISGGTYDEAEILTEEMEDEILVKRSVTSIKEVLQDPYQSEKEILDSLERLNLMQLSVDVLKDTEIGRAVNSLRKHTSKRVQSMARQLVSGWKELVHEWVKSAEDITATAAALADSNEPAAINEEYGLPSPPMDEGALLTTPATSMEMSQLFQFMDDDSSTGSGGPNSPEDQCHAAADLEKHCDNVHGPSKENIFNKQSDSQCTGMDSSTRRTDRWRRVTNGRGSSVYVNDQPGKEGDKLTMNSHHVDNGRDTDLNVERRVCRDSAEKKTDVGSNQRIRTLKYAACEAVSVSVLSSCITNSKIWFGRCRFDVKIDKLLVAVLNKEELLSLD
eukprot:c27770_g1_i4 orf=173-1462(-)